MRDLKCQPVTPGATLLTAIRLPLLGFTRDRRALRGVDLNADSVYVAARNLVFGLILLARSRFGLRSK